MRGSERGDRESPTLVIRTMGLRTSLKSRRMHPTTSREKDVLDA